MSQIPKAKNQKKGTTPTSGKEKEDVLNRVRGARTISIADCQKKTTLHSARKGVSKTTKNRRERKIW